MSLADSQTVRRRRGSATVGCASEEIGSGKVMVLMG